MRPLNILLLFFFSSTALTFTPSASAHLASGNSTHPPSTGTGVPHPINTDTNSVRHGLESTAPHGTGTGSPRTTSFLLLPAATNTASIAVKKRLVHTPSGGFTSSHLTANRTFAGVTGTGTGIIGATGNGATGTVSATGAVLLPSGYAVAGRSQRAARNWWG